MGVLAGAMGSVNTPSARRWRADTPLKDKRGVVTSPAPIAIGIFDYRGDPSLGRRVNGASREPSPAGGPRGRRFGLVSLAMDAASTVS